MTQNKRVTRTMLKRRSEIIGTGNNFQQKEKIEHSKQREIIL